MYIYDNTKSISKSQNRKFISLYDSVPFSFKCFHDQQDS